MNKIKMPYNGDVRNFEENWERRDERRTNWFCRGKPSNQIQFAFQQHWSFLSEVVGVPKEGRCLEVGCGRGSISSFFAESGYKVSLLDISPVIIEDAKNIFKRNGHFEEADFYVDDANKLPFKSDVFDVTISIGLLEHFEKVEKVMSEQIRVLKRGGVFVAYVVPEKWSVQNIFAPLNEYLKILTPFFNPTLVKENKKNLFRTDFNSDYYKEILRKFNVADIQSSGVYPFPAISYSPDFPFSLMPNFIETMLVSIFENFIEWRRKKWKKHPWICDEDWGPAFFVWCKKIKDV